MSFNILSIDIVIQISTKTVSPTGVFQADMLIHMFIKEPILRVCNKDILYSVGNRCVKKTWCYILEI